MCGGHLPRSTVMPKRTCEIALHSPRPPSTLQCVSPAKAAQLRQRNGKSTDSASSSRNASKSLPG